MAFALACPFARPAATVGEPATAGHREQGMSMKEPAAGGVNWDAYSHEELYQMLWEDADVADVSMIATEWSRHRAALDTHAEVLREQRTALLDSWQGAAAEEAANRLDALAARVEKISELAHAGQQAAQEAADALAMARAMMPPPPSNPTAAFTDGPMNWAQSFSGMAASAVPSVPAFSTAPFTPDLSAAGSSATSNYSGMFSPSPAVTPGSGTDTSATGFPFVPGASGSSTTPNYAEMFTPTTVPNYAEMFTPASTTTTTPASSGMGTSFGAVGSAGYSFYFGAGATDAQKAQAVRAMQTYESSLRGSGQLVDDARGAIPPATQTAAATRAGVTAPGPGGGGVPWSSLVGASPGRTVGVGGGTGSVIGSPGAGRGTPLGLGSRFGAMPGMAGPGLPAGHLAAESAAARAASHGGMVPPAAGQRGAEDEKHENQLPTIDHGLFVVEVPTSPPVIGDPTGVL